MWDPYAEFQSATLPNGLSVHAAHWPGRPWEAMGFLIHSGAEHDPVGLEGLSHFVEHLVAENTDTPKKDIVAFLEDCGGIVDLGRTDYPSTCYRFFAPIERALLSRAFAIFGRMLLSARLEKPIEREREVIIGEFHKHYPAAFQFDLHVRERKVLWAGHWLERFVRPLGVPESIGRITRDTLQAHYDLYYTPANMSIVGVGGMALEELVELLLESPFAERKKGVRTPLPGPATEALPPSETHYLFEVSRHVAMATPLKVGAYRSVAKIPGAVSAQTLRIAQKMFDDVAGEEVRERRAWAYAIDSSRHNFRDFHEFSIECDALALEALDHIEEVIEACIASLGDREDMFAQAKRRVLANASMVDQTAKGVCDGALDDLADHQRIVSVAEDQDGLQRVTMDKVRNLLRWLRPEWRWTRLTRP